MIRDTKEFSESIHNHAAGVSVPDSQIESMPHATPYECDLEPPVCRLDDHLQ